MVKVTDAISALPRDGTYFSLEFFPPKTQMGFSNLQTRLERMSRLLRPLFITVTWGAGGSTSERSLELAELCQSRLGLTTCLHLTCTNMKRTVIDKTLENAKNIGVRNILALRGDRPRKHEYGLSGALERAADEEEATDGDFVWAVDLVRYIRRKHGGYFCIGVAAYPEGHADEAYPLIQDPRHDLPYLVEKIKAGADFIMTQLFYSSDCFLRFEEMLRSHESGVFATIPIIPGLMPIQSFETLKRTTKLAHAKLPPQISVKLETVREDDEAVKSIGIHALSAMIEDIKQVASDKPRGFHFYTLNLEKVVGSVLEQCRLIPSTKSDGDQQDSAIDDSFSSPNGLTDIHYITAPEQDSYNHLARHRLSSNSSQLTTDNPSSFLIPPTLLRESIWDDYPNGRFGDARSPAFNPPLSYTNSSLLEPADLAVSLWGRPTSSAAVTKLFTAHLSGADPSHLPWSESASLSQETTLILPHLLSLNARHWWTVASQPAVNSLPSTHPIHGWGPKGGFIFQKAFVEFFLSAQDWHLRLRPHLQSPTVHDDVSWFAVDASGNFESSHHEPQVNKHNSNGINDDKTSAMHAVTWGMFPGKEILTATMVEEVSFRTWAEEAFGLWEDWAKAVAEHVTGADVQEAAQSQAFLRRCRDDLVLVNVVGHEFHDSDQLWNILTNAPSPDV